jgi:hypothetical protein
MTVKKKVLTRDEILKAQDLRTEEVYVPEWGGTVIVKSLTGTERDLFEDSVISSGRRDFKGVRARLAALSIVDENGKRLFTFEEAEKLGEKSARALDRVFAVAQRLSGFTRKDMEELEGKSSSGQSDASTSD